MKPDYSIFTIVIISAIIKVAILGFVLIPILVFIGAQIVEVFVGHPPTDDGIFVAKSALGVLAGVHFYKWIYDVEGVENFVKQAKEEQGRKEKSAQETDKKDKQ